MRTATLFLIRSTILCYTILRANPAAAVVYDENEKLRVWYFTVGPHVNVSQWSYWLDDHNVDSALSGATSYITDVELLWDCSDKYACAGMRRKAGDHPFTWNDAGYDIITTEAELDRCVHLAQVPTGDAPSIKIVEDINLPGRNVLGAADLGSIVVEATADDWVWAHEFGHSQGLYDKSCSGLLMCSVPENPGICNQTPTEVDASEKAMWEASFNDSSDYCHPKVPCSLWTLGASLVSGGVEVAFSTGWETEIDSFIVLRVEASGSLAEVGRLSPQGGGSEYTVTDPQGALGSEYRIYERLTGGGYRRIGDVAAFGNAVATGPSYDPEVLAAEVEALDDYEEVATVGCFDQTPPSFLTIFYPPQLSDHIGAYYSVWRTHISDISLIRTSWADSCYGGVQGYLRHWNSLGQRPAYVLLVGDASENVQWDDPTIWVGWPRLGGQNPMPSQPERNLLPTFYYFPGVPYYRSMTTWTPYYASDLPYADLDGDELPDIVVGRVPAHSVADLDVYIKKLQHFLNWGNSINRTAYEFEYSVDYFGASGFQNLAYANKLASTFPSDVTLNRFWIRNDYATPGNARYFANQATAAGPSVLLWSSTATARYQYVGFWSLPFGWSTDELPSSTHALPISIGLSCGLGDFDMTEEGCDWDGDSWSCGVRTRPIVEQLLFDDPYKGVIAQVGPSRGSYNRGNSLLGEEMIRQLYLPNMTVGKAFMLAQRLCLQRYPEYADNFKEFTYIGDPMLGSDVITGVSPPSASELAVEVGRPAPNPFNPNVRVHIRMGSRAPIRITVYDVHGRVIRTLVDGGPSGPGRFDVQWDGANDHGEQVGSGVYFLDVRSQSVRKSAKLVLLR